MKQHLASSSCCSPATCKSACEMKDMDYLQQRRMGRGERISHTCCTTTCQFGNDIFSRTSGLHTTIGTCKLPLPSQQHGIAGKSSLGVCGWLCIGAILGCEMPSNFTTNSARFFQDGLQNCEIFTGSDLQRHLCLCGSSATARTSMQGEEERGEYGIA